MFGKGRRGFLLRRLLDCFMVNGGSTGFILDCFNGM